MISALLSLLPLCCFGDKNAGVKISAIHRITRTFFLNFWCNTISADKYENDTRIILDSVQAWYVRLCYRIIESIKTLEELESRFQDYLLKF